jgi:TetR/AcrR family transcriptional repressor of nem operon
MSVNIFFLGSSSLRVSRDQARKNRQRVVVASSALFRQRGVDGVGISDLMSEVSLTHGGFYKQFSSKAELVEEACSQALEDTMAFWDAYLEDAVEPRAAFVRAYLSDQHRDRVGEGCLLPALAGEVRREPKAIREVFTRAIRAYADRLDQPIDSQTQQSRAAALSTLSEMVGAILLARVSVDTQLSGDILESACCHILGAGLEPAMAGGARLSREAGSAAEPTNAPAAAQDQRDE